MTSDKNDSNNWLVAKMSYGEGGCLQILFTDQAENVARQKAEQAALDDAGASIFLYQRIGTVKTEAIARWN